MSMHLRNEHRLKDSIRQQVDELLQQPLEVLVFMDAALRNMKRWADNRDARLEREHIWKVKLNEIGD